MNVLILTHFYPPEPCAASNRTAAVARGLYRAGHGVSVVTGFPSFPTGRVPARYRGRLFSRESDDGIRVTRLWNFVSPVCSSRNRLLNWGTAALATLLYALWTFEKVDAVYASSPPITLALPSIVAKIRHRCRLVVDVRDAYPEVAVRMGIWRPNGRITRLVGNVARVLYGFADAIVCVTQGVGREVLERGAAVAKVCVAANGFDSVATDAKHPFARADGAFVVAFVGNMGLAAGTGLILDAAGRSRGASGMHFVLVGDGSDYETLRRRVRDESLDNVHLLGALPREAAMAVLRDADVCVVPLRRDIVDSLPTKMFDALWSGCPLLVAANGEARQFLERSEGGWAIPPEDPDAMATALAAIRLVPLQRAERARKGRAYVQRHYDRARNVEAIVSVIERACTSRHSKSVEAVSGDRA
ncbi:MAG TPA: glycosyltransferase family 4 protein [Candidatus Baltobacteraceae bacterium]